MPIALSQITSPRGVRMARTLSTGEVVEADVDALLKRLAPGGEIAGLPYLAVTERNTTLSAGVRGLFSRLELNVQSPAIAVVVSGTALRLVISFILRVAGKLSPKFAATPVKLFPGEAEAIDWLEQQVAAGPAQLKRSS